MRNNLSWFYLDFEKCFYLIFWRLFSFDRIILVAVLKDVIFHPIVVTSKKIQSAIIRPFSLNFILWPIVWEPGAWWAGKWFKETERYQSHIIFLVDSCNKTVLNVSFQLHISKCLQRKFIYYRAKPWNIFMTLVVVRGQKRERERCHIGYIDIITTDHPGPQACVFDYNILILSISNIIVYCYKFCVHLWFKFSV